MSEPRMPIPARLELNFPRVFVSRCGSFMEFRVTNVSPQPLLDVRVTLSCGILGFPANITEVGGLRPGESRLAHLDTLPEGIGSQVLRCQVEFGMGRDWHQFEGTFPHITVYERPETVSNVSVVIQDIQSNRDSAAKSEMGGIKGDVNISLSNLLPKIQTVNDLIQLRLPDAFFEVGLTPGRRRDFTEVLNIPAEFLRVYEPAESIHLAPAGHQPIADDPSGWRLVGGAGSSLFCGRSTADCDFTLRFFPASEENKQRTTYLSRRHARLHHASGHLYVENASLSGGLLCVGQQPVKTGTVCLLPESDLLSLGQPPGEYRLRCRTIPPPAHRTIRIANLSQWAGRSLPETEPDWGLTSVLPENSVPAFWNTLWFHSRTSFGSGVEAAMMLDTQRLDPIHGYVHHRHGMFWLENASSEGGGVSVDGIALGDGDIAPLRDGAVILLGDQELICRRQR